MLFTRLVSAGLGAASLASAVTSTTAAPSFIHTRGSTYIVMTILDGKGAGAFAVSVIAANPCSSTFVMQCTDIGSCSAQFERCTIAQGASENRWKATYTSANGTVQTVTANCKITTISSSSAAVCVEGQSGANSTFAPWTTTYHTSDAQPGYYPITAGETRLDATTVRTCVSGTVSLFGVRTPTPPNLPASRKSPASPIFSASADPSLSHAGAAAATGLHKVLKILVAPAAAVAALAGVLV